MNVVCLLQQLDAKVYVFKQNKTKSHTFYTNLNCFPAHRGCSTK